MVASSERSVWTGRPCWRDGASKLDRKWKETVRESGKAKKRWIEMTYLGRTCPSRAVGLAERKGTVPAWSEPSGD